MEKIAVETEIWPADVKYAEEITEESLAKLGEKFMQRMWELPRGKKVCVSCMEQRETPPSGMPMVIRILLDVQEVLYNAEDPDLIRNLNLFVVNRFYLKPYDQDQDFYIQFYERLKEGKELLALA